MSETQAEAHRLLERGLPITLCPPNSKKPLGEGWDAKNVGVAWQRKEWSPKEVDRAFKLRGDLNVGVLFGPRSGMIDIEEDKPEDRTAFNNLFLDCPPPITATFQSGKGPHRIFAWHPDLEKIGKAVMRYQGMEVRIGANGKGAHSAFPPSKTNDKVREWLIPLDECDPQPLPSAAIARLFEANGTKKAGKPGDAGEAEDKAVVVHREHSEHRQLLESSVCSVSTVYPSSSSTTSLTSRVQAAIVATLPNAGGQRHRQIFAFARHLKAIPALANADLGSLRPYVEWWHESALPVITTKAFEETWYDFRNAWPSVKFPAGEEPVSQMYTQAISKSPPQCADRYQQTQLRALIALCRELQLQEGSDPFFLAGRIAAVLIGVDHKTAARWLKMLCMDEVLRLSERGNRHQASEYFYLGDD
jgi:hypothetical protein